MKKLKFFFLFLTACGIKEFPAYDLACRPEFKSLGPAVCAPMKVSYSPSVTLQGVMMQLQTNGFGSPFGIALSGQKGYVGSSLHFIVEWNIGQSAFSRSVAGQTGQKGDQDGLVGLGRLNTPRGLAVSSNGSKIFIADSGNNKIKQIDMNNLAALSTLVGSATGLPGTADGRGTAARFNDPQGIAITGNGDLYVTDTGNNRIRRITQGDLVQTFSGGASGYRNGAVGQALFRSPDGIFADSSGIYILDKGNYAVRMVDTNAGSVRTLAGSGVRGYRDDTGTKAAFWDLQSITGDGKGNLYIGDAGALRKIEILSGRVSTVAGYPLETGTQNGSGSVGRFSGSLNGLVYDAGNSTLYIIDESTFRKIAGL